jgi:hypothetical protein
VELPNIAGKDLRQVGRGGMGMVVSNLSLLNMTQSNLMLQALRKKWTAFPPHDENQPPYAQSTKIATPEEGHRRQVERSLFREIEQSSQNKYLEFMVNHRQTKRYVALP